MDGIAEAALTQTSPSYWRIALDNPPLNVMGPEFVLEFRPRRTPRAAMPGRQARSTSGFAVLASSRSRPLRQPARSILYWAGNLAEGAGLTGVFPMETYRARELRLDRQVHGILESTRCFDCVAPQSARST
jgi:hypothetical protein